jgi:uncharacterized protein YjbI with pentapeptide repeats
MRFFVFVISVILSVSIISAEGSLETDDTCGNAGSGDIKFAPVSSNPNVKIEKFVSDLDWPTTMAFVGSDILVLQKNNGLVCHVNNGVLEEIPVLDVKVSSEGEQGLLGITTRGTEVFLYFTEAENDGGKVIGNHVYKYSWNGSDLVKGELVKQFPGDLSQSHVGGAMTTDLDGTIYVVVGDMRQEGKNQNFESGNEYETGVISPIDPMGEPYAKGIRNSFGLTVDPVTGNLWDTENGLKIFDEVNLVPPKFNSGWKKIMGPANDEALLSLNIEGFQHSDPEFSWETPVAPTAISFVDSMFFPEFSNSVLVGDFNTGSLYEFKLNHDRTAFEFDDPLLSDAIVNRGESMNEIIIATGFAGITDIEVGPDGMIYIVSIGQGAIYQISPTETSFNNEELIRCSLEHGVRTNLIGCDFSDMSLQDKQFAFQDMSYVNLSGANLTGSSLLNSNLTGANLNGADLSNSDLSNVILSNSLLKGTNLSGATMSHSIFTGAEMQNVKMKNSNLLDANFNHANLENADLRNTNMAFASMKNTILKNSDLSNANLNYAILLNAELQEADLSNADLYRANFSGSNLSGSGLLGVYPYTTDFTGVIFSEETKTDSCLDTDFLSRFLNKILREFRQYDSEFTKPLESLIVQICRP